VSRYIGGRLAMMAATIIGILTVVFFLMRAIPGDPAAYILGNYATTDALNALRHNLGLDQPLIVQYAQYLLRAAHGDLGTSIMTRQPALSEVFHSVPPSAALAIAGVAIAVAVGVPLGILSATKQGTALDISVMVGALSGISFPVFWVGLVAILLFAHALRWFPAVGAGAEGDPADQIHHLILPAIVLGLSVAAYIARLTRSAMLEVLNQDFIRTARSKGLAERFVIWRHALRNALVPVLAVIGVTIAWAFGNAILVEIVFSRPGLGSLILKAVSARDYPLVQASVFVLAVAVVLVNTAIDILYGVIDPRIRTA
jgi:peptide/nickel transport system permease protein